jgi:hypothetical protein
MKSILEGAEGQSNPSVNSNRPYISKRQLSGKCGSQSKTQLRKIIPDMDTKNEENVTCIFLTKYLPNQNSEKGGLKTQISKTCEHNTGCQYRLAIYVGSTRWQYKLAIQVSNIR